MEHAGEWPSSWIGTWIARDGKAVTLIREDRGITVTVGPALDQPAYLGAELLDGSRKRIQRLPAACRVDDKGRRYLEVEAGTPEIGPTYRLYAVVEDAAGTHHAGVDVRVERVVLVPSTVIGLYDDWDDDLGVPWAYPLDRLRRQAGS